MQFDMFYVDDYIFVDFMDNDKFDDFLIEIIYENINVSGGESVGVEGLLPIRGWKEKNMSI